MKIVSYLVEVVVRFMKGSINWVMVVMWKVRYWKKMVFVRKGKYWKEMGRQSLLAGAVVCLLDGA